MKYEVIIIGGGPVGLSAAICLAQQGIRSILIEKHPTITNHPKARGVNGRSMELLRLWGLEEQIKQYQMVPEARRFIWFEDFLGKEIARVQVTDDYTRYSPTENAIIAQDDLEQELFKKAQSIPLINLRFNTEMINCSQNEKQVSIEVLNKAIQQRETLSAPYLIAADGAKSSLRKIFNVEMDGVDNIGQFCNIYCEMNIDKYVEHRPSASFFFTRADVAGTFMLSKKGNRKWLIGMRIDTNPSLTQDSFTEDFCIDYVKRVLKDPEIDVRFINNAFWTMAALNAQKYRVGRVFFAGDAAHRLPPTGGFGMNTGIQDVHNLAWKLAMVLRGQAHESLLDSYFDERAQIAQTNIDCSLNNAQRFATIFTALKQNDLAACKEAIEDQTHHVNNILLDLGFVYGTAYQEAESYNPSAQIGARAPHCWLVQDGKQKSTLDLYSNQFVLVCSPEAHHWKDQFHDFPCKVVTIGEQGDYMDPNNDFLVKYEISQEGAVLVRPDGHVAWRSQDAHGKMAHFPWLHAS